MAEPGSNDPTSLRDDIVDSATGSPETPDPGQPDYFATILRRWKDRRTVQLTLAYAASGYAIIQFIAAALRGNPSLDTIVSAAWTIYWLGLAIVIFAVPLVLTGTHRFRSGLIAGIVVTSLAAGMYLQTRLRPDGGGGGDIAHNDSTPATQEGNILGNGAGRSNGPTANGEGDTADTGVPVADNDPGQSQLPADDPRQETTARQAEPQVPTRDESVRTDSGTSAATQPGAYDRLVLLYGDKDSLTLENRPGRVELFAGRANPIVVRFAIISGNNARLMATVVPGRGAEVLELETVGAENNMMIRIPTSCGTLTYRLEAVRLLDSAEVTIAIDEARSRQEVTRAEGLDDCRVL